MSAEDFVVQYIEQCASEGIVAPASICEKALEEIQELEKQINAADLARIRKQYLTKILKQFNHKSVFKVRNSKISPVTNLETAEATASSATEDFMAKICEYIEQHTQCSPGDILNSIGDYRHNEATFGSIKTLLERDVLTKEGRMLIKGEKWDERPKL